MSKRHDWFRSFKVRGSVLPRIFPRLALLFGLSLLMTALRMHERIHGVPLAVLAITGSAVGLHIAFRTNSGYERFWEARTAWGVIVNRSRNIGRQVHTLLQGEERKRAILLAIAFVHGAKRHFWRDDHVPELEALMGAEQARALHAAPGVAQRSLLELGAVVYQARRRGALDSVDQLRVEQDITSLLDQFGVCQRIRGTPLPAAYVIQLRTALGLFLTALPLGLVDDFGWFTPLVSSIISYVFLGMEQIGTELEDPFERTINDVDMSSISQRIESDLLALCDACPVAPPPEPEAPSATHEAHSGQNV